MKSSSKSESLPSVSLLPGGGMVFNEPSLTKQMFRDECDVNLIVKRAREGSDIRHLNSQVGDYFDCSSVPDYRTAMDFISDARAMFMALDSSVRDRFANDPANLIDFLSDPSNRAEGERLGFFEVRTPSGAEKPLGSQGNPLPVDSKPVS